MLERAATYPMSSILHALLLLAASVTTAAAAPPCPMSRGHNELLSRAEASLGGDLPVYAFCVYGRPDDGTVWLFSMHAHDRETGRHLSELTYPPEIKEGLGLFSLYEIGGSAPRPAFVDFDFDGYLDVSLLSFVGGTGNAGANVWRYDPDEQRFVYEQLLSGHTLDVDPVRQELTSAWTGGHAGGIYSVSKFRWIEGRATLVRYESRRWDQARNCYDLRVQEWRGTKLVETEATCTPIATTD